MLDAGSALGHDDDTPHEECGVFGIYAPGADAARLTFFARSLTFFARSRTLFARRRALFPRRCCHNGCRFLGRARTGLARLPGLTVATAWAFVTTATAPHAARRAVRIAAALLPQRGRQALRDPRRLGRFVLRFRFARFRMQAGTICWCK